MNAVAFSTDGLTMATGSSDQSVVLWDLSDPARPQRIGQPLLGHSSAVNVVAFSPDGLTLATGSSDQSVVLWDLRDPARPQRIGQNLLGAAGPVHSVTFTPDGRTLATAGEQGTILWDLAGLFFVRDNALSLACARTGGGIDPEKWTQFVPTLPYDDPCVP